MQSIFGLGHAAESRYATFRTRIWILDAMMNLKQYIPSRRASGLGQEHLPGLRSSMPAAHLRPDLIGTGFAS
jgi:hypothetical protein